MGSFLQNLERGIRRTGLFAHIGTGQVANERQFAIPIFFLANMETNVPLQIRRVNFPASLKGKLSMVYPLPEKRFPKFTVECKTVCL